MGVCGRRRQNLKSMILIINQLMIITHRILFNADLGAGRVVQDKDDVDADTNKDSQFQGQDQTRDKSSQTRNQINLYGIIQ